MKIVVDKMPESHEECVFARLKRVNIYEAYICQIPRVDDDGVKRCYRCCDVKDCDKLVVLQNNPL